MYVTVDLDYPTRYQIVQSWYRVSDHSDDGPFGRISSSGEGVHIRSDMILPKEVGINEEVRRYCNDDRARIDGDIEGRVYRNQVFFKSKGDKVAGEWTDNLDHLIGQYERSAGKPGVENVLESD